MQVDFQQGRQGTARACQRGARLFAVKPQHAHIVPPARPCGQLELPPLQRLQDGRDLLLQTLLQHECIQQPNARPSLDQANPLAGTAGRFSTFDQQQSVRRDQPAELQRPLRVGESGRGQIQLLQNLVDGVPFHQIDAHVRQPHGQQICDAALAQFLAGHNRPARVRPVCGESDYGGGDPRQCCKPRGGPRRPTRNPSESVHLSLCSANGQNSRTRLRAMLLLNQVVSCWLSPPSFRDPA
jgi:hypothetical protein